MLIAMADLRPCPACARHVRSSEAACPFCDATLPEPTTTTSSSVVRAGRAAMFIAGAALVASAVTATSGCGDRPKPRDPNLQKPYGAPPADGFIV